MKGAILAAVLAIFVLSFLLNTTRAGFRGGSEAIGGRTGGTAYSGATTDLDPGMP
jgi:hypothetical protein